MKRNVRRQAAEKSKLDEISKKFRELEQDEGLPSFGEFLISCLVIGNSECVNLKQLFPEHHRRLSSWLQEQRKSLK